MQPSLRAVFGWANERFSAHWPGLFAIGFLAMLVPAIRMAAEQGNPRTFHPWVALGIVALETAIALLCTAAMILLVTEPEPATAGTALRAAFRSAPRLIVTGIVGILPFLITAVAVGTVTGKHPPALLALIVGVALLPLQFVGRLAFAGAVIERTGPFVALRDAFRRASIAGLGATYAFSLAILLLEQSAPQILVIAANTIFPPDPVSYKPWIPPGYFPQNLLPTMQAPGRFGSGIPWPAFIVIRVLTIPVAAYVATLFAGAAFDFADAERLADRALSRPPFLAGPDHPET